MIRFATDKTDLKQVSIIHASSLKDGILTSLGQGFLFNFYKNTKGQKNIFTLVAVEKGKIIGFATGAVELNSVTGVLFPKLWKDALIAVIKNPILIPKLIQIPFYPSFKNVKKQGEIFSLAVEYDYRGRGIGEKLVDSCKKEFIKRGYNEFIVSVRGKTKANRFYKKIGMIEIKHNKFLGEKFTFWQGKC